MNRVLICALLTAVCLTWAVAPCAAAETAKAEDPLAKIYGEAKEEFFVTLDKLLARHPLRSQLSGDEVMRLHDARTGIPHLFDRLMTIAYQKRAPQFSEWIKQRDAESLKGLQAELKELARDYAGRFVGSLFQRGDELEFSMALPHNRGKGRLDLVLQALGYNAKNDAAPVPPEQQFINKIPAEFYSQWTTTALNATQAQQISKGAGVIVAVVDSGLDPYNTLFKGRTVPGFSFLQRTKAPWEAEEFNTVDWGWHGTVVSSEVMLLAPDCRIMPIRALDGNTMNDPPHPMWAIELMAAAIYYAVHNGAHIVQVSAALPSSEPVMWEAVRYAYHHNVVVSTSAGNISRSHWGLSPSAKLYRSFDNEVLLVGGVAHKRGKYVPWEGTLPGPQMTVSVPASDVFMIAPVYAPDMKDDYGSGTSLASPLVSGTVALMRSAAPPSAKLLSQPGAYVKLVKRALQETARLDVLGLGDPNDIVGQGLVDSYAAVQKMRQLMSAAK